MTSQGQCGSRLSCDGQFPLAEPSAIHLLIDSWGLQADPGVCVWGGGGGPIWVLDEVG